MTKTKCFGVLGVMATKAFMSPLLQVFKTTLVSKSVNLKPTDPDH